MSETAVVVAELVPPQPPTVECPATTTEPPAPRPSRPERPSSTQSLVRLFAPADSDTDESGRSGSPINCSICLGRCDNKCFTDACMHYFCYACLVEWSKIKPECPLCKKPFRSIIYNVISETHYDEYIVQRTPATRYTEDGINIFLQDSRRFRYSTTLSLRPHESNAIQQLFSITPVVNPIVDRIERVRARDLNWRIDIYQRLLYACPLYDITGRLRDCSAFYYSNNPAQIFRLMPWVQREVLALLDSDSRASYCTEIIQDLLTRYSIYSREFREQVTPYFQRRTEHFIHEFLNFARSPFDMIGYDRIVQYAPYFERVSAPVVLSSGASSPISDFSDIEEIDLAPRTEWTIETRTNNQTVIVSGFVGSSDEIQVGTNPTNEGSGSTTSSSNDNNNIVDDSLTQTVNFNILSDTDSDECVFVKAEKPPHLRTPELVSLNSETDSDCVITKVSYGKKKENEFDIPSTSSSTETKPKIEEVIDYSMPSTSRGIGISAKPSTSDLIYATYNQKPTMIAKNVGQGFKRIYEDSTSSNSSESSSHEEYRVYPESKRKKSPVSMGLSPTKIIKRKKKHFIKKKESKSEGECSSRPKPKRKLKTRKRVRSTIKDKLTKTIVHKHFTKKVSSKKNNSTSSSTSDSG